MIISVHWNIVTEVRQVAEIYIVYYLLCKKWGEKENVFPKETMGKQKEINNNCYLSGE